MIEQLSISVLRYQDGRTLCWSGREPQSDNFGCKCRTRSGGERHGAISRPTKRSTVNDPMLQTAESRVWPCRRRETNLLDGNA
jgi:hypothetical protein